MPTKRHVAHQVSGVYFLYDGEELVYIGKTANILKRIGEHSSKRYGKKFDSYSFIECTPREADRIEGRLIRKYCPKYNEQYAGVKQHIPFESDQEAPISQATYDMETEGLTDAQIQAVVESPRISALEFSKLLNVETYVIRIIREREALSRVVGA